MARGLRQRRSTGSALSAGVGGQRLPEGLAPGLAVAIEQPNVWVQVNGKTCTSLYLPLELGEAELFAACQAEPDAAAKLAGRAIARSLLTGGAAQARIVNFITA